MPVFAFAVPAARRVAAVVRRVVFAEGARRLAAAALTGFFAVAGNFAFVLVVLAAVAPFADRAVDIDFAAVMRAVVRPAGAFAAAGLLAPFAALFFVAGFTAAFAFAFAGFRAVALAVVLLAVLAADFVEAVAAFLLLFALLAMSSSFMRAPAARRPRLSP